MQDLYWYCKLIFTIKLQKPFDNKSKSYYIIISNNNTRGKLMNEIFPKGFNSWTAYYRHNEKVAKVKYWVNGILGMIVLFGAIALDGYINVTMGM